MVLLINRFDQALSNTFKFTSTTHCPLSSSLILFNKCMYVGHAMHTCLYTNLDPIVVILTYYLVPKARLLRPNLRVMINDYVIITLTCDLFNTTMTIGRGSSSSKRLRYVHSSNTKKGRVTVENTLNKKGVRDFQAKS